MKRLNPKELKSLNESCSNVVNNKQQLDESASQALGAILRGIGKGIRTVARTTTSSGRQANKDALGRTIQRFGVGAEEAAAKTKEFFTGRNYSLMTSTARGQRQAAAAAERSAQDAARQRVIPEFQRIINQYGNNPNSPAWLANMTPGQRLQVQGAFKAARGVQLPSSVPGTPPIVTGRDWVEAEKLLLSTHPSGGAKASQQALSQTAQKAAGSGAGTGGGMGTAAAIGALGAGTAAWAATKFLSARSSLPSTTVQPLEQGASQGLSNSLGIPELTRSLQQGVGGSAREELELQRNRK